MKNKKLFASVCVIAAVMIADCICRQKFISSPLASRAVSSLGLAIVKQTVDMHNGICSVESSGGKGSTFWIELDKC